MLVDRLVVIDCIGINILQLFLKNLYVILGNLGYIGLQILAFPIRVWSLQYLCPLISFYRIFVTVLNRFAFLLMKDNMLHHLQVGSKHNYDIQSTYGLPSGILLQVELA